MAALTFTAAQSGANAASWTFTGGTSGAGTDTIANAELQKGTVSGRLLTFLQTAYASDVLALAAFAALGCTVGGPGILTVTVTRDATLPSFSVLTSALTGSMRLSLSYSAST